MRYILLKIMKKMRQLDDDRPIMAAAEQLLDKILFSAFHVFNDAQFRRIANFDKISQAEHDRIFNELEVSSVCLCIFILKQREFMMGHKDFHFWEDVCDYLPESLKQRLVGYGVSNENAKLLKDLIKMRYDEYEKISNNLFDYIDNEDKFKEVKNENAKNVLNRVNSIAVGTADHIRRGKLKEGDELIKYFHAWLFPLDIEISKFIRRL